MLKSLHKNDTQTTPFVVTKNWELSNVTNEDLILMEHSGSDGLPVALEYLEYGIYTPITASNCNIAKEQQTQDKAKFKNGLKVSGLFYPETDPQNQDGTYQRVVYAQVVQMFYNDYRDPTKMWGLEEIDFEKSQTKKFVSDKFKMFEIPQGIFGEKVLENTVVLLDTTTDNDYIITDDGHCNLFAGTNLFSHQQEIGKYLNEYLSGSSGECDVYNTISPPDQPVMTAMYNLCSPSVLITWNINGWPVTEYVVERSTDGINYTTSQSFAGFTNLWLDTAISYSGTYWYRMYAVNLLGSSSYSTTASIYATPVFWDNDPDFWNTTASCGPTYWDSASLIPIPAPDNLIAYQIDPYVEANQLSWSYYPSESLAEGFVIERSNTPFYNFYTFVTITSSYVTGYVDTAVTYSNDYAYRIYAYSGSLTSSYEGIAASFVYPPPFVCKEPIFPAQYFTESLKDWLTYDLV